jgi:hypothetical protein
MLSKCANPACGAKLHYLGDGKIYRTGDDPSRRLPIAFDPMPANVSSDDQIGTQPAVIVRREYFWLCRECSQDMTLAVHESSVVVVPIRHPNPRRAAAAS